MYFDCTCLVIINIIKKHTGIYNIILSIPVVLYLVQLVLLLADVTSFSRCIHCITAKPFFEKQGLVVDEEQKRKVNQLYLTNYKMSKRLI